MRAISRAKSLPGTGEVAMPARSKSAKGNTRAAEKAAMRYGYLPAHIAPVEALKEPLAIGDLAEMFGVTHRALHFYEEKGLLASARHGLMRIYNRDDVGRMALINACRDVGMPVAIIQQLVSQLAEAGSQIEADRLFREALSTRKRELSTLLATVKRQLQQVNKLLSLDDEGIQAKTDLAEKIELTELERRCIELMAEGYAPMRLARALDLKSEEVAALEADIIRKFDANNRFQAVAKAVLLGIVGS